MEIFDRNDDWSITIMLQLETINDDWLWVEAKSASLVAGHGSVTDIEIWLMSFKLSYE
jgi:hypothetical protein